MHWDAALWEASRHAANPPATGSTAFQLHCHFWLRTMWPVLMLTKTAASLHAYKRTPTQDMTVFLVLSSAHGGFWNCSVYPNASISQPTVKSRESKKQQQRNLVLLRTKLEQFLRCKGLT